MSLANDVKSVLPLSLLILLLQIWPQFHPPRLCTCPSPHRPFLSPPLPASAPVPSSFPTPSSVNFFHEMNKSVNSRNSYLITWLRPLLTFSHISSQSVFLSIHRVVFQHGCDCIARIMLNRAFSFSVLIQALSHVIVTPLLYRSECFAHLLKTSDGSTTDCRIKSFRIWP